MTPRKLLEWSFSIVIIIIVVFFTYFFLYDFYVGGFPRLESIIGSNNPLLNSIILVSFAALISTLVVFFIRSTRGSLEFSLLGIKFKGPSGPITLWILSFLTIVVALSTFLGNPVNITSNNFNDNPYYVIQNKIRELRTESEKFDELRQIFRNDMFTADIKEPFDWANLLYQYTHVRFVIDDVYLDFRTNRDLRVSLRNVSDHLHSLEIQISDLYGENFNSTEWIRTKKFSENDFKSLPSILKDTSEKYIISLNNDLQSIKSELAKNHLID